MNHAEAVETHQRRWPSRATLMGFAVFVLAVAAAWATVALTKKQERRPPPRLVPLVRVEPLLQSVEPVRIPALGTVIPAREVHLQAQVTGEIVAIHPDFVEGGFIPAGETVVEIDRRDYELAVAQREARVETARSSLRLEEGQQAIAQREWDMMGGAEGASDLERELALRQPQLRNLKALLAAAEAELEAARLSLERTRVRAPFDAVVRAANVKAGDLARSQEPLGVLCATDRYWVRATVRMDHLAWIRRPGDGGEGGSAATVRGTLGEARAGRVIRLLSDLEPAGRMARVLIEVEDPLQLGSPAEHRVPLLLDEYVRVEIEGRTVENVYRIPRAALRDGRFLWLADAEDKLRIRPVAPIWTTADLALVRDAAAPGERLVVSGLSAPVEGMTLRIESEAPAAPGPEGGRP